MSLASPSCSGNPRLVGDPVDVITGVQTDVTFDFKLPGPLPVAWNRYYSSDRHLDMLPIGFGHTHGYDHRLSLDLDGLTYRGPSGNVGFPELAIGQIDARVGLVLRRPNELEYHLALPNDDVLEFDLSREQMTAPLKRLVRGKTSLTFAYGQNGRLVEVVDALKRSLLVATDAMGRISNVDLIGAPGTSVKKKTLVAYEYDQAGHLVRAKDTFGFTLLFQYDARGLLTRRTDRRGYSFLFTYDAQGRCIHSKGEDGLFEVHLDYDPQAKATFVRKSGNPPWTYFHNDAGALTQIVDPYGAATNFILDDEGRTVEEIDPNGNVTKLHYDWRGHHDYRIDPNGYFLPTANPDPPDPLAYHLPETPLEWELGRLVDAQTIQPPRADDRVLAQFPAAVVNTTLGKTTTYDKNATDPQAADASANPLVADDFGRLLEQSGPRFAERWKYDANGNRIEHRDRDGSISKAVYGSWNALRQEIDPLGNVTAFENSAAGLVSKIVDPGGTEIEYGYDFNDKLVEVRRNGRIRERYIRDKAGNIIAKNDATGRTLVSWEVGPGNVDKVRILAAGDKHEFEHDERGRVTSAKAPSGTVAFAYDENGEIVADQRDGLGVVHELDFGQLVRTTYFDKFKVDYKTDDNGDFIVLDPSGGQHRFQRSPSGLIAKRLANGTRELCQFDDRGRCLRKTLFRPGSASAPWMRSYVYSTHGDLVGINDTAKGPTKYAYDAAHRLTEETIPGRPPRRFAFDAAGNMLVQPGLANAVVDRGNLLREANGERFECNDRDLLSARQGPRGATRYEYDDLDMLVKCVINGAEWTASYDVYCRRVKKTWQGRTTTYYWDDFRLAAEMRHDGSVRIYIYVDTIALVPFLFLEYDGLDAPPESGQCYGIFTNQIGVPVRVEDAEGKPCWTARIDPYGLAEIGKDSTLEMPLRFPGHYFDPETGLHFNRFRYFSPELGRFLQWDPAGQLGGINLHGYPVCPLTGVDIDGLNGGGRRDGRKSNSGGGRGKRGDCDDDLENEGVGKLDKKEAEQKRKREADAAAKKAAEDEAARKAALSPDDREKEAQATRERKAAEAALGPTGPQLGDRAKVGDDAQQKADDMARAKRAVDQGKSNAIIDSDEKTQQRAAHELKSIKSGSDVTPPDSTPPPPPPDPKPKE